MLTKDYIIPSLGGRLGNNLFMVAHAYAKGLKYNKQVVINRSQLSYEGNNYSQNIFSKLEFVDSSSDNENYNPAIPSEDKHSIYGGYYQNESYFEEYSEAIKSLFGAPLDFINRIRNEIPVIFQKTVTVINIRRGDYLHLSNYHPVVSADYVNAACDEIPNTQQYLIASDDIAWCKRNLTLPDAIYLEGYKPEEQLWILSMCHNFIISNSSFSWWAAYLSRHDDKIVIAPQTWYGPEGPKTWEEIYCKEWKVLPTYFKNGFIYPTNYSPKEYKYKIILKTTNKNLSRVDSCAETWLKGLDFVCLTDKLSGKYPEISGSSREDYSSAEEKTVHMINLVRETNDFDSYDWLVFIDDDAILNVNRWKTVIQHLNKDNAYGLYMHGVYQPQPKLLYPSGGAGYFLSPQKIKSSNPMTNKEWGVEDAAIGKWLEENNIKLLDHYFVNGKYYQLLLNGWFPFPKEYDELDKQYIDKPEYPTKLLEKVENHDEKKKWLNKHLTHHYIRHKEFMKYINNAFMDRLTEIANKLGTDKGTTAFCGHSYTVTYNELFEPLLPSHVKMLEIGVADPRFPGASLKMWNEYFPDITLIGYDINPSSKDFEENNVHVFIGDQNNPEDLAKCIQTYGGEFDIIMDDGSHHSEHILTSFKHLFPHLKNGGYYIIEDLHSVYSNAAFTIPEVSNIIEREQFNVEHLSNRHNGKMIVIKKASLII